MSAHPEDPLAEGGILGFGSRLRSGEISAETAVRAYVARIERLDVRLNAFEHVDAEGAIAAARRIDRLLGAGPDLGPLMGVCVAVKDICAVDGGARACGLQRRCVRSSWRGRYPPRHVEDQHAVPLECRRRMITGMRP